MPTCERCGCSVPLNQLLYHEAMHDQQMLLFQQLEAHCVLADEAINLLHELIHDLEAKLDV